MIAQTPPDLSTIEGREADRAELRAGGRMTRFIGFVVVIAGAGALITAKSAQAPPEWLLNTGWALLVSGWLVLGYAFVQRTLYHRRRIEGRDTQGQMNARG